MINNAAAWERSESPVSKQRVDGKRAGRIFAVEATCVQVRYMTCIGGSGGGVRLRRHGKQSRALGELLEP